MPVLAKSVLVKLAQLVVVIWGISTLVFFLTRLSGNPAAVIAGADASPELIASIRAELGLDDPLGVQYGRFMADLLRLDFGASFQYGGSAFDVVASRIGATVYLTVAGTVLALGVGVPLGIVSAVTRSRVVSSILGGFSLIGQCVPTFVIGILAILIFSVQLNWLPSFGMRQPTSVILPALTLSMYLMARQIRVVDTYMRDELRRDYVLTVRARGYTERRIRYRHVLRNVALPLVALLGADVGAFFAGGIVTEAVFAWPGLGRLVVDAVHARDYPVLQASVFVLATGVVLINFTTEFLYQLADPRSRREAN